MHYNFFKWAVASALLMCSSHGLFAQNTQDWEKTLNPVVVTATGTHSRQHNSAGDVQVITRENLSASHITNLEDALLMLAPGISRMTNGMGTFVSLNGLNDDYILILENGKRITGEDRLGRINISAVKRIEVLSGGAGTLYGSDAVAGVINIITDSSSSRKIEKNIEPEAHASIKTEGASKGRISQSATAELHLGRLVSNTAFQYRTADNYQVNKQELVYNKLMPTGRVMSQGFRNHSLDQRLAWNFDNGLQVYLRGNYNNYHTNRPQTAKYYKGSTKKDSKTGLTDTLFTQTAAYSYDLARETFLYGAGASWRVNKKTYLEADFFCDNLVSERDSFDTSVPGGTQLTKLTRVYDMTMKGIFNLSAANKLSAGMEMMHETYRSYNFSGRHMNTFSTYVQDEVQIIKQLKAVAGLRFVQNQFYGSYLTPSVQLMSALGPFSIRAGYSTGYRSPTLSQIFYENDETKTITIGNQDLKPEKSNFFTFGVSYMGKGINVGVKGFYNAIRDMISYRTLTNNEIESSGLDTKYPTATKYQQRDNIDEAKVIGLAANISCYLPYGFSLGGSYTLQHTEAKSVTLDATSQTYVSKTEPIDRSVKSSGNFFGQWNKTWSDYRLAIRMQGRMQGKRWSTSYGYAPAYSQFDLTTTHTWQTRTAELEFGIGIENIFNDRDERPWCSNFSTLNPGRSVMASFAVKI